MRERRAQRGFTVAEVLVVVAIIAVAAAMAIPSWRNMVANNRLRGATSEVASALSMARARAIASGNNVVVYFNTGLNFGDDICNNPLEDVAGNVVPILVFDDGPPGNPTANCCIDAGDTILETYDAVPGIGWGTALATGPAPGDADPTANYVNGPTFTDPNNATTEWILFRPDGIPVGFQDNGGPCAPGATGSGDGAVYLTNNNRDASVVLTPLGGVRSHLWERSGGVWTN